MTKLITDISTLTDVSEYTLKKFIPLSEYCVGHAVYESLCSSSNNTTVDIGIGDLVINVSDDSIRYRFIPSKELERIITTTVCDGTSPLITKLDENLQQKIDKVYRELL